MRKSRFTEERIVDLHRAGSIDRDSAIDAVARDAFNDVIPAFHVLGGTPTEIRFYEPDDTGGLVLTDNAFDVLTSDNRVELLAEIDSRWDLLEAAFQMKRDDSVLDNDVRAIYLAKGYERRPITHLIPVLNGYQSGVCFYCGEMMMHDIHVDHVMPRQFVYHDEIWNLVLAHGFCNAQKSDALPGGEYIEKLIQRNEHFIASNHPIKPRLIRELGRTPTIRARYIYAVYADARLAIRITWEGLRGYQPATDPFYKSIVRSIAR
jgi:5-methylcytosine-specific restriction endonuclease McrA